MFVSMYLSGLHIKMDHADDLDALFDLAIMFKTEMRETDDREIETSI